MRLMISEILSLRIGIKIVKKEYNGDKYKMNFTEENIKNKIKGTIAEQIFEIIHMELGCQVFKTGQESLFPTLFYLANKKRKGHHLLNKESDINKLKSTFKDPSIDYTQLNNMVNNLRFTNSTIAKSIASSPDFTIVTHAGDIYQFEVKYRKDGILSNKDKQKYLNGYKSPFMFILMQKKPYIKILYPYISINSLYLTIDAKGPKLIKELKHMVNDNSNWEYREFELSKNGSIELNVIDDEEIPLDSNKIVYTKKLLDKYGGIIKEAYSN